VHVGNVVVDVVLYVPALPAPGGDVLARANAITVGGGFNVLVAAIRQGLPAVYAGTHGTGPFGDRCRTALTDAGITMLQPQDPDRDTGFTVALVDDTGERTFATAPGAEADLDPSNIVTLPDDIVYVSGYSLVHNGSAFLPWLSTVEGTVIVDPGPLVTSIAADVLAAVLARADWVSCNEREATAIPTRPGMIVRTGEHGCLLFAESATPTRIRPFPVQPVDTNGAGDAHVGAFAAALAAGLPATAAALRANAAAAIAVTRHGPATAPTSAEVDQLLAGHVDS
jgi:sugar/nucleoside kinase (ribokinase family)